MKLAYGNCTEGNETMSSIYGTNTTTGNHMQACSKVYILFPCTFTVSKKRDFLIVTKTIYELNPKCRNQRARFYLDGNYNDSTED